MTVAGGAMKALQNPNKGSTKVAKPTPFSLIGTGGQLFKISLVPNS